MWRGYGAMEGSYNSSFVALLASGDLEAMEGLRRLWSGHIMMLALGFGVLIEMGCGVMEFWALFWVDIRPPGI
jgi:hypothetical protein